MELKITPREAFSLSARCARILTWMEAGLFYRWDLGYNELLSDEELDAALQARKVSAK